MTDKERLTERCDRVQPTEIITALSYYKGGFRVQPIENDGFVVILTINGEDKLVPIASVGHLLHWIQQEYGVPQVLAQPQKEEATVEITSPAEQGTVHKLRNVIGM